MAGIITDREAFYKFSAPEIWAEINPKLGESLRLSQLVVSSIRVYNAAYPPPPPSWSNKLGTVVFAGICVAVLGAAYLSASGVTTGATTNISGIATNVATSANTASVAAAAATGTAAETVVVGEAVGLAGKVAAIAGPIAKTISKATGNTTAGKISAAADIIANNDNFTDAAVEIYKKQLQEKNGVLTAEGEAQLRELTRKEQEQYVEYLSKQAESTAKSEAVKPDLSKFIIPGIGLLALILKKE